MKICKVAWSQVLPDSKIESCRMFARPCLALSEPDNQLQRHGRQPTVACDHNRDPNVELVSYCSVNIHTHIQHEKGITEQEQIAQTKSQLEEGQFERSYTWHMSPLTYTYSFFMIKFTVESKYCTLQIYLLKTFQYLFKDSWGWGYCFSAY